MVAERLEGALATLVRVGASKVKQLHAQFQQDEGLRRAAALREPPTLDDLKEDLADDDLLIWEIFPDGDDDKVGYAGLVMYSGPPFVFVHLTTARCDLDVAQDAVMQLVHSYFQLTEYPELWTYQKLPLDEEIRAMLVEGGFDAWEDALPGIDLTKEAAFLMERHTYEAYYGETAEDERELDF